MYINIYKTKWFSDIFTWINLRLIWKMFIIYNENNKLNLNRIKK